MLPFIPCPLLVLLLAAPALLTPSTSRELQVRGQRAARDTKQDSIKVVISEGCATQGDSSDVSQGGKEIDLTPGSPLVLTHKIKLVPSGSDSGSGSCGCETEFAALRERLERLEREVSALREKCGGAEGGCCTSKESKGAGCSIKPETDECPNECSDQGRCVDGKCVCFPGFKGPDCSQSNCPGNCNDNGRCVNGQCVCDPGFTGPDCLQRGCPDNCNNRGRCVNGRCVCDSGFTGPSCSDELCPGNCNNRGRCVNGQCVCNPGFTGPDCSNRACPGNCNNRGRCINGQCVCNPGFAGPDCSKKACPDNCNNRGRCVNGKCVCDSGFAGDDCSENSCPGNCNNRGRCVNGQCVCNDGFTGADCSVKACPNNCNNRGKCVNGKCVCDVGFAGPDCAAKGCPNNCNNKGRCVKGRCVCRRGFTGPDCSQCEEGMTGPNCDTVMSGVSQLITRDITETSVTLVWTPPPVQYETYHITFTSQKESDQQITVQVEGSLTTFTQTGLAAGQEYTVSISGEIGGRRGTESSSEFMTLISGPTNLQVVKTTSTSAVVQWEHSQGEIDRYRLTVTPNDGAGRSQEMTVPVGQNSAQIQQLEAGHLYDIILVAEKGSSRSEPATTQFTPGNTLPRVTTAALTMQVTLAPGQDVGNRDQDFDPLPEAEERGDDGSEADALKVGVISCGIIIIAIISIFISFSSLIFTNSSTIIITNIFSFIVTLIITITFIITITAIIVTVSSIIIPFQLRSQTNELEEVDNGPVQIAKSGEEETGTPDSNSDSDIHTEKVNAGKNTGATSQGRPTIKQSSDSRHGSSRPVTLPKRQPPMRSTQMRHSISGTQRREDIKANNTAKRLFDSNSKLLTGSDVSSSGVTREPLDYVGVTNRTSDGFALLSPGSSYEVSVISILGLDESDPIRDFVMTLPDPPTDLRAVNVTDTKALLLWRPALAAIDKYDIVYGSGTGSEVRVTVSGNAAEQQLSGLEGSTTYTVTITSQLGSQESPAATTTFTTAGGSGGVGEGPRHLQASNVTPRTALLSWKLPSNPVGSYRLTYQTEGYEMKEVILDGSVTEYNLTRLLPGSTYTAQLQADEGGRYTAAISAEFTTGTLRFPFPTDCSQELLNGIRTSGEAEVFPQGRLGTSILVYCDMETDGGGWTVFQRRKDGSVDFFRGWKEYVKGFGDLSGEFWLGLDSLHNLTTMARMSLRIDLRDKDEAVFAKYSTFEVAKRNYKLTVGGYSGTAGDSLSYHNNRVFSTKDRDPAPFITRCAMSYRGGWWYKNCHEANLNGLYGIDVKHQGVIWTTWKGKEFSIPFTEMKMRPAAFSPPARG
ncbi:tenascin-like [Chaetodon auriga]|uniref:tenascin-like n=1 Tax=Chaetodon auriga TaxID=39042 RepID=UPI004032C1CB